MKKIMGILIIALLSICLLKPKEKEKLDNVVLKLEVNNKTFAMYKEEGDSYVPVEGTKFPEMYVLNLTESKCIDNNGNELNGVLSYENDKVVLTTNKSSYCYLYFDKSLGEEIKEKTPKGLSLDKVRGAMYRFQGQQTDNVENYICFGTNDNSACTQDTDKYMYRIIGIEASTGRVKVIKKEALEDTYQWYTDYHTDVKLPESKFFQAINGDEFLTNTTYVPNGWAEKISDNTWIYGDMWENSEICAKQLGAGLYDTESGKKSTSWYVESTKEAGGTEYKVQWTENDTYSQGTTLYYKEENGNWSNKVDSKISLMYLHDYSYSVGDDAKCNFYYGDTEYSKCKLGWIHLSQNDSTNPPSVQEWTMSRYGWDMWRGAFLGFYVNEEGYVGDTHLAGSLSVRPVFYLTSVNQLSGGIGTLEDPFIIKS